MTDTSSVAGASIPHGRVVTVLVGLVVLGLFVLFLRRTRYGLVVRAGVENRAMVTALGIDVRRAFTLVFTLGGAAAGLAGALAGVYFGSVTPGLGSSLLIYAFIVVVIGGLGSVPGSALAAAVVGLVQQFTNYYAASGIGDLSVVLLLAVVLLVRPQGLLGRAL
jgi:branched-chain amino acid transport system permease protein